MIRWPLIRIRMSRATEATAPTRKKDARRTAAVGTEMGRLLAVPEKMSMMRPMQSGIERETTEETMSCIVR